MFSKLASGRVVVVMHEQYRVRCGGHGDGARLRERGVGCRVCSWDGWTVFDASQAGRVAGYNGRSVAVRGRRVKPGALGKVARVRSSVGDGSRFMARSAESVAVRRLVRSAGVDAMLAGY